MSSVDSLRPGRPRRLLAVGMLWLGCCAALPADDAAPPATPTAAAEDVGAPAAEQVPTPIKSIDDAQDAVSDFAEQVDRDPRAKEVSAGILQPIYLLAESIAVPSFHWIAFAIMATGVVSYALQLVLGKLAVLMRGSLSPKEILSDALGLVISVVGLVLTTQAAAENSTFTTSPAAVLSASAVGILAGFVFYLWGQRQELEAARGRATERR